MASQSRVYTDGDIRFIKWTFIITRVASRPIRLILQNETVDKGNRESYFAYFERTLEPKQKQEQKQEQKQKLKCLYAADTDLLKKTDTKLEDLDISLLYKVIRYGNRKLADGDDKDKWMGGNSHIESLIAKVKDLRNELFHKELQISEREFKDRTEMLRKLLTDLMSCAAQIYHIDVTRELHQVNIGIDKYRDNDIEDEDFVKYRFDKHCEILKREGKVNIENQYKKLNETVVNTVNPIVDLSTPVDDIFSDMELEKSQDQGVKITYQNILEGVCYTSDDPLILVEGDPGVGKTTLVKKVISEWMNDTKSVIGLDKYSLLLHHEFRNAVTEDFNTLLKDRMPDLAKSLKDDELRKAALHLNTLIILDGLDEVNDASVLLFEEVLHLKRNYGITVMITSRPEKLGYLKSKLNSLQIKLKHICLLGIPLDQREAFVERYHKKMAEKDTSQHGVNTPDIGNLKKYLEETKDRLSNLWRLPYNLTFLTILYIERVIDLDEITTAPELYKHIFLLYRSKLKERLRDFQETKQLLDSKLNYIINIFLHALAKESILGLIKNQINLQNESYKRLEEDCIYINVPAEQMIGAFLKSVPSISSQIVYGYPHKGIQDYLSALYVWMLLSREYQSANIHKAIGEVFAAISKHSLSPEMSHSIMQVIEREMRRKQISSIGKNSFDAESTIKDSEILLAMNNVPQNIIETNSEFLGRIFEGIPVGKEPSTSLEKPNENLARTKYTELSRDEIGENLPNASGVVANQQSVQESTIIRDILQDIYRECSHEMASNINTISGSDSESEINKFQNMLMCLLGMFYTEGKKIQNEIKLEALKLLEETGVKNRKAWLNVLSNVKCDAFVVSFIARQKDILKGWVRIDDSSLLPYLSLMKSLENPPENATSVKIHLDIKQFSARKDLLDEIKRLHFEVDGVTITDVNVEEYLSVLSELKGILSSDHKINITINNVSSNVFALLLLCNVNSLNIKVIKLELETHFRYTSVYDLEWQTQINQIMERCPVESYRGTAFSMMPYSQSLTSLWVSVENKEAFKTLHAFLLLQSHSLEDLQVCVSADLNHNHVKPLPSTSEYLPSIYIDDVRENNLLNAVQILRALQPVTGEKKFEAIFFPRYKADDHLLDLIEHMRRMEIQSFNLGFPSSLRPKQQQQQQLIEKEAKKKLGCLNFSWGSDVWSSSLNDW